MVATQADVDSAVEAAVGALAYSLTEQDTGLTFLGNRVYQITVAFPNGPTPGSPVASGHGISSISAVLRVDTMFTDGTTHVVFPTPGDGTTTGDAAVWVDSSKLWVASNGWDYSGYAGVATLLYVK